MRGLVTSICHQHTIVRGSDPTFTCFPATDFDPEKPGGSGILAPCLGLEGAPWARSRTHLGGGGTKLPGVDIVQISQG